MKNRDWRMENGKIKCGLKWTLMFLFSDVLSMMWNRYFQH